MTNRKLTKHALVALRDLVNKDRPRQEHNPGLCKTLLEDQLVEPIMLASPYKSHRGRSIEFLRITSAGREALESGVVGIQSTTEIDNAR